MRRHPILFASVLTLMLAASAGHARPAEPTLPGQYDPNNDYARAARGEAKVALLYQDRYAMAYLAHTPFTEGHFIVVSKQSTARNFMEVDPKDLVHMWAVAKIVAQAEIAALGADGFIVRSNAGSAGATAQFHIHVITRKTGVPMDESRPERSAEQLEPLAARIRAAIR